MISISAIIVIAFAYVCLLFLIAYISDKNKFKAISPNRKALVYSFSLAIYCSSWTFYGAVGTASVSSWGYFPVLLGPILVYTLGWPFLQKFIRIGKEQNTTSLADFIASRYGKSQSIAAIVTIIAVIAIIPYIALQLKAITLSISVFDTQQNFLSDLPFLTLYLTISLIVFSILFGARDLDVTEHQYGMMNAIAFESIVKLVAFCAVGIFALYSIYDGPSSLIQTMVNDTRLKRLWFEEINLERFITQSILAATAIFCLPRQFHVSVVEYHQEKDLRWSRWIFPGYLILISLFVIPIAVAGSQLLSENAIDADTYILALPIAQNQSILSAIVFIGGLSAATAMVIVATVALSTMISNELVLPIVLHKTDSREFKDKQFSRKMLITRRIAIGSCLILAYIFYRQFDQSQSLASIGYLSFTAVLQFMPALILGLLWSKATKVGAIIGLLGGIVCWFALTLIPSAQGANLLTPENSFSGYSLLTESLCISLVINFSGIYFGSFISEQSLTEKIQAYAYTREWPKDNTSVTRRYDTSQILVKDLKSLAAAIVGSERMVATFDAFSEEYEDNDLADNKLITLTENLLSASIGASSARVLIITAFKERGIYVNDVINLLNSTSQALKFNRDLVTLMMDNIDQGICVSDGDKNIVAWNHAYEKLMDYPKNFLSIGKPVAEIVRFNAERGFCGPGEVEKHVKKRIDHLNSGLSYRYERIRNDGVVLKIVGNPLPHGGYVTTFSDISEYKKIEAALKENERQITIYTDNSPAALAYLDSGLIFRFVNQTFANIHRMQKEDILGRHINEVIQKEEIDFKREFIQLALQNNKQQFEFSSDVFGSKYYLVTYIPDLDSGGEVIGVYTISQDITNRRKAELALKEVNLTLENRVKSRTNELNETVNALEATKVVAEKANQDKSRFLAAASHDLLQPFNAARLFNEMLQSETGTMTRSQAQLVEKTDQSLAMAENIIRSLTEISKLDSGTVRPTIRVFNIRTIFESLEQQFSGFAENKGIIFRVIKKDIYVKSDSELLYRILQNFVSNAIRYTKKGGILISTQKRGKNLRVSVWDTGIGIKEEDQSEIFNEFTQISDPEISSERQGLGLGLSISKRLASILEHPIEFLSQYGRGTAFHILVERSQELNTKKTTNATESQSKGPSLKGIKVLCVDNEPQITDAMSFLLERWGCEVKTAQEEKQIDQIITSEFIPDILLVDYQLDRGKTGIDIIHVVKGRTKVDIPVIVITADHSLEVEKEIKQREIKLLYKPIKPAMLRATMNSELS